MFVLHFHLLPCRACQLAPSHSSHLAREICELALPRLVRAAWVWWT